MSVLGGITPSSAKAITPADDGASIPLLAIWSVGIACHICAIRSGRILVAKTSASQRTFGPNLVQLGQGPRFSWRHSIPRLPIARSGSLPTSGTASSVITIVADTV